MSVVKGKKRMQTLTEIQTQIKAAKAEALRCCGQSDVLYESLRQAAYRSIMELASNEDRLVVEAELREEGFDPDFAPYVAAEGECSLTGIEVNCCQCGYHDGVEEEEVESSLTGLDEGCSPCEGTQNG